jgi:hypothetical protein
VTALDAVRAELADVVELLDAYWRANVQPGSAEWLTMEALRRREVSLHHELSILYGSAEVEIRLQGGAEKGTSIDSGILGELLRHWQGAIAAVVQSRMRGEIAHGYHSSDVRKASLMRVAATPPGSFKLLLDGPSWRGAQQTVEGREITPPFDEAVSGVLDVLAAAKDSQDGALSSRVAALESPRAVSHVRNLVKTLARSQTTTTVVQRSPFAATAREVSVPAEASRQLQRRLSQTRQTTTTLEIEGNLEGVRWGAQDFELRSVEEPGRLYEGRIVTELRPIVRENRFDHVVRAVVERTATTYPGDEAGRVTYRLVGIRDTDGNLVAGQWSLGLDVSK